MSGFFFLYPLVVDLVWLDIWFLEIPGILELVLFVLRSVFDKQVSWECFPAARKCGTAEPYVLPEGGS